MIGTAIWQCFGCYSTKRTQMDTEATAVETPYCCEKQMWLVGVPADPKCVAPSTEASK